MPSWMTSLTIAEVIGALIAIGGLAAGLKWVIPLLRGVHDFLSDWAGEPSRPGRERRPGVIERLQAMERVQSEHGCHIESIRHQVENTHTTNLRQDLDGLSAAIASLKNAVDQSIADRRDLHESIDRLDLTIRTQHPDLED